MGRRFRSLKLWFVLRIYGAKKIREHIQNHVNLAKRFAAHVESDPRFELTVPTNMGLACFNIKNVSKLLRIKSELYIQTLKEPQVIETREFTRIDCALITASRQKKICFVQ